MKANSSRKEVNLKGVKILGVTSPNRIAQIAEERKITPREVFVRVVFEYSGSQYNASNQLRFFGEKGYEKLLQARDDESLVNITVIKDDKGTLMYLDSDKNVTIAELFKAPALSGSTTTKDLSDLF